MRPVKSSDQEAIDLVMFEKGKAAGMRGDARLCPWDAVREVSPRVIGAYVRSGQWGENCDHWYDGYDQATDRPRDAT
jgi:hypothetical protein